MKRLLIAGVVGVAVVGAAIHVAAPRYASAYESSCWASLLVDSQQVHTRPWARSEDLGADLDGYTDVHWHVARPQAFLPHVPKPHHCEYQLVLRLEPAHARRLVAQIAEAKNRNPKQIDQLEVAQRTAAEARFPEMNFPWLERPTVWPALEQFVPTDGLWAYSAAYDEEHGPPMRRTFVDEKNLVAVATFALD